MVSGICSCLIEDASAALPSATLVGGVEDGDDIPSLAESGPATLMHDNVEADEADEARAGKLEEHAQNGAGTAV